MNRLRNRLSFLLILISFLLLLLATGGCQKKSESVTSSKWQKILTRMEIILATSQPDSIKAARLKQLFRESQVTPEEYRQLYRELVQSDHEQAYRLLVQMEKQITEELRSASARHQSKNPKTTRYQRVPQ
jgi:hypothetical protein